MPPQQSTGVIRRTRRPRPAPYRSDASSASRANLHNAERATHISTERWNAHADIIKYLYLTEDLSLTAKTGRCLVDVLREKFGFNATKSQLENFLAQRGLFKNLSKEEWKLVIPVYNELRSQGLAARILVSGRLHSEKSIKRGQEYCRSSNSESVSHEWMRDPAYQHITIEVQDSNGCWTPFSPTTTGLENSALQPTRTEDSLNSSFPPADPGYYRRVAPACASQEAVVYDPAAYDTFMEDADWSCVPDVTLDVAVTDTFKFFDTENTLINHSGSALTGNTMMLSSFDHDHTTVTATIDRWAMTDLCSTTASASIDLPQVNGQGLDIFMPAILKESSPFFQLGLDLGYLTSGNTSPSQDLAIRPPTMSNTRNSIAFILNENEKLLEKSSRGLDVVLSCPSGERLKDQLRSLLAFEPPRTSGGTTAPAVLLPSSAFERKFADVIVYSFLNGFAGFRGVSRASIFKFARTQRDLSERLLACVRDCPEAIAKTLADNLLSSAIEAGDDAAVRTIVATIKRREGLLDIDADVFKLDGFFYTPLQLAIKLRLPRVVKALIQLGADVNATAGQVPETSSIFAFASSCCWSSPAKNADEESENDIIRHIVDAGARPSGSQLFDMIDRRFRAHDAELLSHCFDHVNVPPAHQRIHARRTLEARGSRLGYMIRTNEHVAAQFCDWAVSSCHSTRCSRCDEFSNERESIGLSLLLIAAKTGSVFICRKLEPYACANEALLGAAIEGHNRHLFDLGIKYIREREIVNNVDTTSFRSYLERPLTLAQLSEDDYFLKRLRQLGARRTKFTYIVRDLKGAVTAGDVELAQKIIKHIRPGRHHGARNRLDEALTLSIEMGNTQLALILLGAGVVFRISESGLHECNRGCPLCVALKERNEPVLNVILEHDVVISTDRRDNMLTGAADDDDLRSPVSIAAKQGDAEMTKTLVEMGFVADASALFFAFEQDDANMVETLDKIGALDDEIAVSGALLQAVTNSNARAFSRITAIRPGSVMSFQADLTMPPRRYPGRARTILRYHSLLRMAAETGDPHMVERLLRLGATPADEAAMSWAVKHGGTVLNTVLRAFREAYPRGKRGFGALPLIEAVDRSDEATTMRLIDVGLDTNLYSREKNCSALGRAIQRNKIDLVRRFLAAGARLDRHVAAKERRFARCFTQSRHTALLAAVETLSGSMVQLLLEEGAEINQPAKRGVKRTPLQSACELGNLPMVNLLVGWGADIHAPPAMRAGGTALQLAAGSGSMGIVQLLLSRGADIWAATSVVDGRTPLQAAAEHGCLEIVRILWDQTEGRGFAEGEVEKAIVFAKAKGHRGPAEYVQQLQAASAEFCQVTGSSPRATSLLDLGPEITPYIHASGLLWKFGEHPDDCEYFN